MKESYIILDFTHLPKVVKSLLHGLFTLPYMRFEPWVLHFSNSWRGDRVGKCG